MGQCWNLAQIIFLISLSLGFCAVCYAGQIYVATRSDRAAEAVATVDILLFMGVGTFLVRRLVLHFDEMKREEQRQREAAQREEATHANRADVLRHVLSLRPQSCAATGMVAKDVALVSGERSPHRGPDAEEEEDGNVAAAANRADVLRHVLALQR